MRRRNSAEVFALIGSAYSFYPTQKTEMETLAARSLQVDLSLAQYGPEAEPLRSALRSTLGGIDGLIWGDGHADPQQFKAAAVLPSLRGMVARFSALTPASDTQKQLLGAIAADEGQIQQTRLLMSLQRARAFRNSVELAFAMKRNGEERT